MKRVNLLIISVILGKLILAQNVSEQAPRLYELNMSEYMFEIFYEWWPKHIDTWEKIPNEEVGASYKQSWDAVLVKWNKTQTDTDTVFSMIKNYNMQCQDFDRLVFFVDMNKSTQMHVSVKTDKEELSKSFVSKDPLKEYKIDLNGANEIKQIKISFTSAKKGIGITTLRWIGFQDADLYEKYLSRFDNYDTTWNKYLQPIDTTPNFEPEYGLIFSKEDIQHIREKYKGRYDELKIVQAAKLAMQYKPEPMIGDYINLGFDNRFSRDHDRDKFLVGNADPSTRQGCQGNAIDGFGVQLAIAGAILQDEEMLRMAARYGMSIAMSTNWDQSALCRTTGVLWEHRSYLQSMLSFHCAVILDLAGDAFTRYGKQILLRRIVENGLGQIAYTTYRFDYIFKNNSHILFQTGAMAGALAAEQEFNRIGYTKEEILDFVEHNMDNIIYDDGGFAEGPGYFTEVIRGYLMINYMYANMHNKDFKELVKPTLKNTENYVAAVLSTVPNQVFIPISDGSREDQIYNDYIPFMANLFPDSYWVFLNTLMEGKEDRSPSGLFTLLPLGQEKDLKPAKFPEFITMENNGFASSLRKHEGKYVKVFIMGNPKFAGHNHEDVGSFVLEWAGETYAMDPGMTFYSDPATFYYRYCQYHNMLLPYGVESKQRISPLKKYRESSIVPTGTGNNKTFSATIDPTPTWDKYYKKWVRHFDSPSPDKLTITDEYELLEGEGVEFIWNTELPVSINENVIKISGNNGHVLVEIPEKAKALKEKVNQGSLSHNRIIIRVPGVKGKMSLKIRFM